MSINQEKLAKLQAQSRVGGKGTPRRKVKKTSKSTVSDDKRLQSVLKKLPTQNIGLIDEVNFFTEGGSVIHFSFPKMQTVAGANTYIVTGNGESKEITELLPGILSQLGPESIMEIRKMAEAFAKDNSGMASTDN